MHALRLCQTSAFDHEASLYITTNHHQHLNCQH